MDDFYNISDEQLNNLSNYMINVLNCEKISVSVDNIDKLPIYLIIAHSEIGFFINKNPQNTYEICPNILFEVSENKFIIYTTPGSTWSMLYNNYNLEEKEHILNKTQEEIISNLFSPKLSSLHGSRIELQMTGIDRVETIPNEKIEFNGYKLLKSGFFIPGSKTFNKCHQFFGEPLTGNSCGIIKLSNNTSKYNTRSNIKSSVNLLNDNKILEQNEVNEVNNTFKPYFLSNEELTENDEILYKYIQTKAKECEDVTMQEIINRGDDGIYISLSCSELGIYSRQNVRLESREDYTVEEVSTDLAKTDVNKLKLQLKLDEIMIHNYVENNKLWDKLCKKLHDINNKSEKQICNICKNIKSEKYSNLSTIQFWYSPRLNSNDSGWMSREKRKKVGLKPRTRIKKVISRYKHISNKHISNKHISN